MNKSKEKIKTILIKKWKWLLLAIVIIFFIVIAEDVFEQEIMKIDTIAYTVVVENLRTDWLTNIMKFVTNLGGIYILPIICLITLIVIKEKKIGIAMFSNLILISVANVLLKQIVQRARPDGYRLILESGYSFPSGHSMISTAFYGLIIYYIYKYIKNKKLKYTLCTIFSLLIVLIAFSRVYLGVHYASDVIAGFLVSIAYLICFITWYNMINIGEKMRKKKVIKRFVRSKRKKLINSFKYAICGFKSAYKKEQNLKIHILIMIIVIIAGIIFRISRIEWIVCIILFGLVISTELMNTAVEALVDVVMPEINPKAKFIKDVAASSVLASAISSAIIGLIIFIPKIINIVI